MGPPRQSRSAGKRQRTRVLVLGFEWKPWDMNLFRDRKLHRLLTALNIQQAGFHALRHFNVSLLRFVASAAEGNSGTNRSRANRLIHSRCVR